MDTQCNIVFQQYDEKLSPSELYESKEEINLNTALVLQENSVSTVLFTGPADAKLFLDELQFSPSDKAQFIYTYQHNTGYPFTTGYYIAEIFYADQLRYFPFIVAAKIPKKTHETMVKEVEQFIAYLSQTGKNNVERAATLNISYVVEQEQAFIQALKSISDHPKKKVELYYELLDANKVKVRDERSQQYAIRHPQEKKVWAPLKKQQLNILENQLVKQMVKQCKTQFSNYLQHYVVADLKLEKVVKRLLYQIDNFLCLSWVEQLPLPKEHTLPLSFIELPSYRTIFAMQRHLKQAQASKITIENRSLKSSSELYEIWCFVQLIYQYEQLGYTIVKNNLSFKSETQSIIFDAEQKNYVELQLEQTTLRLFYEDVLPNFMREIDTLSPICTMHNNKPDCRIDFWQNNLYKGSHLIDFKYRKMEYVWNRALKHGKQNGTIQQLASYALAVQSNSTRLNGELNPALDRMPTKEAWALYPFNDTFSNPQLKDYQIRFIPFTPGEENIVLRHYLQQINLHFIGK